MQLAIGLDIGTSSARALLVRIDTGEEIASAVAPFEGGKDGVLLDSQDPLVARQEPSEYRKAVISVLKQVAAVSESPSQIVGIGLDATASTPMPVAHDCAPLADGVRWKDDMSAQAWLWKDHTAIAEAEEIVALCKKQGRPYLAKCGGSYSSEWFWSKLLHCARKSPEVIDTAHSWMESLDWIVAWLTGCKDPSAAARSVCAAGHKGLYCDEWGGWPEDDFLAALDPRLVLVKRTLTSNALPSNKCAGGLSVALAIETGLSEGTPVAVGAIDAHAGAVGSGVKLGTLVKIIGTSACDILVAPSDGSVGEILGISGVVQGSVVPEMLGIEAGQAAVGDLFDWCVDRLFPGSSHDDLTAQAERLRPGESGLVALDWNNGCRSVLADQNLTGLLIGQTLATKPHEVYRALLESTAFGARKIIERLVANGVPVNQVVACGGVAEKNPLLMQIFADVLDRPIVLPSTDQACALGSAVYGSVAGGGHGSVFGAIAAMTSYKDTVYSPRQYAVKTYDAIYAVYSRLYDSFGDDRVMKDLIKIRNRSRSV